MQKVKKEFMKVSVIYLLLYITLIILVLTDFKISIWMKKNEKSKEN